MPKKGDIVDYLFLGLPNMKLCMPINSHSSPAASPAAIHRISLCFNAWARHAKGEKGVEERSPAKGQAFRS